MTKDQLDVGLIEKKLKTAFTDGAFLSYRKFGMLQWTEEQVDVVYANKIRLAGLSGLEGKGLERIVKLALAIGFPNYIHFSGLT